MAIYEYRCERDGAFDVVAPIGTAPATVACPACAGEAARVFSNPMVSSRAAGARRGARPRAEDALRAGHRHVAAAAQPAPMARMTPQLAKLPRP